jgi:hypothetical protein
MAQQRARGTIDSDGHPEAYPPQLPEFSSADEAGEFFDSHSAAPYLDAMEEVTDQITVDLSEARTKAASGNRLVLRLPRSLHRDLAQAAERDGVALNELAVVLIARGLGWRAAADAPQTGTA